MPKANGSSGNCYRVSREGTTHGYFETETKADNYIYIHWYMLAFGTSTSEFTIEKWFIEGEF